MRLAWVVSAAIITRMRRIWIPLFALLVACRMMVSEPEVRPPLPPQVSPSLSGSPSEPATHPSPTTDSFSWTPTPRFTPTPIPATVAHETAQAALDDTPFTVRLHPDGPLYVGDIISLEIIAPPDFDVGDGEVQVNVGHPEQDEPVTAKFEKFGIGSRDQATLYWIWDTSNLPPGDHNLTISVLPGDITWMETVALHPGDQVPPPEPEAAWARAESDCCLIYYITGTPAERDLNLLLEIADTQFERASQELLVEDPESITITFLPRVLGHGGFASQGISVSYLDRNYAGDGLETVLHHEFVHILDNRLGGEMRPTIFVEGLAVYLTGGHFKPEAPLIPRTAALLPPEPGCTPGGALGHINNPGEACGLDWYIPLETLLDNFYFEQHEIGYLEAGALVEFMVDTWGWEDFMEFYRNMNPQNEKPSPEERGDSPPIPPDQALGMALQTHFSITLEELEARFLEVLSRQVLIQDAVGDVRLTINYYDTVRRYQRNLDPSAYFLTAWLPSGDQMRQREIVADFLRRPSATENFTLETMLVEADAALRRGEYKSAQRTLDAINVLLDDYENGFLEASAFSIIEGSWSAADQ